MKRILVAAGIAALMMLVGSGNAAAQDDEGPNYQVVPVEDWVCTYNEGKGPADLKKANDAWNEWMDEAGRHDYYAATLTPQFHADMSFADVLWLGSWKDGNAMGAGLDAYLSADAAEVGELYTEVITCKSHSSWISMTIRPIPESDDSETDNNFVLSASDCSFKKEGEDVFEEFMAAQAAWNAYADEVGIRNSAWLWWPLAGVEDPDYDFKYIVGEDNHTTSGANWQKYAEGHWRKSEELFEDLIDCDVARVYDGTTVRRMGEE